MRAGPEGGQDQAVASTRNLEATLAQLCVATEVIQTSELSLIPITLGQSLMTASATATEMLLLLFCGIL